MSRSGTIQDAKGRAARPFGVSRKQRKQWSEERGISLAWVMGNVAYEAMDRLQKQGKALHDFGVDVRSVEDLTFIQLKEIIACGDTGFGYGIVCPRDQKPHCSIVDAVFESGHSAKATIFVSWVWGYTLAQMLSALGDWKRRTSEQQRCKEHYIWWCFFCNNQYRLDSVQRDPESLAHIFGGQLKAIGSMIIVIDSTKNPRYPGA